MISGDPALPSFGPGPKLDNLGNALRLPYKVYSTYAAVVYPFVRCVYCFVNAAASSCYYATLVTICHLTLVPMGGIISRFDCMPKLHVRSPSLITTHIVG